MLRPPPANRTPRPVARAIDDTGRASPIRDTGKEYAR